MSRTTTLDMNPQETVRDEHERLTRRTDELCRATEVQALKPFDKDEHEALVAALRDHHAALRAHIERKRREDHSTVG